MSDPTWADFVAAFPLFRDAILAGMAAGAVLGFLGVFVILRRMVFVTAGLTQVSGLGVALGFYADIHLGLHIPPLASAVCASLLAAWVLSLSPDRLRLSRETVLALVWLVGSGGAVLVGDRLTQEAHDIAAILFGSAVIVLPEDLALVVGIGSVVFTVLWFARRGLVFAGYDHDGARVQGIPVRALELLFVALLTLEVSVCTRALGALPVFAFTVLPGMAALLAVQRLSLAFWLAPLFGAIAGGVGYLFAFFFSFPVGASQTAVAALVALLMVPVRLLQDRH